MELYRNEKHNSYLKRRKETFFEMIKKLGYYEILEKSIEVKIAEPVTDIVTEHDWNNKTYSSVYGNSDVIHYILDNTIIGEFPIDGPLEEQVVGSYEEVKKAGKAKPLEDLDYGMLYLAVEKLDSQRDQLYYNMFNKYDEEENSKVDEEIKETEDKINKILNEYFGVKTSFITDYSRFEINKIVSQHLEVDEQLVDPKLIEALCFLAGKNSIIKKGYYEIDPDVKVAIEVVEALEKEIKSSKKLNEFKENRAEQFEQDSIRREQIIARLRAMDIERQTLMEELENLNKKGLK